MSFKPARKGERQRMAFLGYKICIGLIVGMWQELVRLRGSRGDLIRRLLGLFPRTTRSCISQKVQGSGQVVRFRSGLMVSRQKRPV